MPDKSGPQTVYWALFSLKGRMRVQSFRWGAALIGVYWWITIAQLNAVAKTHSDYGFWMIIFALTVLISTYCIYALCHKRIHDFGYSGYYALFAVGLSFFFLPFAIFLLIGVLSFKDGDPETNNYGPPPLRNSKTK